MAIVRPEIADGALLLDNDNDLHWRLPAPEQVTEEMIDALFARLRILDELPFSRFNGLRHLP